MGAFIRQEVGGGKGQEKSELFNKSRGEGRQVGDSGSEMWDGEGWTYPFWELWVSGERGIHKVGPAAL